MEPTTPETITNPADDAGTNHNTDHSATGTPVTEGAAPPPSGPRRLFRLDGPVSGVSSGLADYLGVDATFVRLGLVAGTLLGGPVVPVGYVAAWAIIPQANPAPVAPIMAPQAPAPAPAPVSPTA